MNCIANFQFKRFLISINLVIIFKNMHFITNVMQREHFSEKGVI